MCWTYWIFNQLLTCASRKDAPLTMVMLLLLFAESLNVNVDDFTCVVECSYFTKQAFVRGEVIDATFRLILARSQSC